MREIREELGVTVRVGPRAAADVATVGGTGTLRTYWAHLDDGRPQPLEHAELRWLTVDELHAVDWLPADVPVVAAIARRM
ncbi:MAG: 8-oxo-dGTP diphosphatase [Frankiaceae bacterium]|nr:8-oxo-dGTP diphosphatase [Frankiaceae bacterium]